MVQVKLRNYLLLQRLWRETNRFWTYGNSDGIFQKQFKKKPLTIVRPGTQTRRFTHISDTVDICIKAWKNDKCSHYSISHKETHSIKDVAKMFGSKITYLPYRAGERYASALTNISFNNKVNKHFGKINLKDYITSFIKSVKK